MRDKQVILNPGRRRLQGGEFGIVIGTSQNAVDNALSQQFTPAPPLEEMLENLNTSLGKAQPSIIRTLSTLAEVISKS